MGISVNQIKDPKLRAKIINSLGKVQSFMADLAQKVPRKTRIRQDARPLMNKLEAEFHEWLRNNTDFRVYPQALRFRLANGLTYTPDFYCTSPVIETDVCYEVKGKQVWDDAIAKVKMAANLYSHISWYLVWKDNPEKWSFQKVLS